MALRLPGSGIPIHSIHPRGRKKGGMRKWQSPWTKRGSLECVSLLPPPRGVKGLSSRGLPKQGNDDEGSGKVVVTAEVV